jgi:hypothetical protein
MLKSENRKFRLNTLATEARRHREKIDNSKINDSGSVFSLDSKHRPKLKDAGFPIESFGNDVLYYNGNSGMRNL